MTKRALVLGYAAAAYLIFLAVLGYSAGFFIDAVVPKGIDQGPRQQASTFFPTAATARQTNRPRSMPRAARVATFSPELLPAAALRPPQERSYKSTSS